MNILLKIFLLQLVYNCPSFVWAQWCTDRRMVFKTRAQANYGQRLVTKRNFFGGLTHKYEPYRYTTLQVIDCNFKLIP